MKSKVDDLDRLRELGLIDLEEWALARWQLALGAFELVSGHWVAERFPDFHHLITSWIGWGNFSYHIDRDMVLHCEQSKKIPLPKHTSIKKAWAMRIPKNL